MQISHQVTAIKEGVEALNSQFTGTQKILFYPFIAIFSILVILKGVLFLHDHTCKSSSGAVQKFEP